MLYVSSSRVLFDERERARSLADRDARDGRGEGAPSCVFTLAKVAHRKALPLISSGTINERSEFV